MELLFSKNKKYKMKREPVLLPFHFYALALNVPAI